MTPIIISLFFFIIIYLIIYAYIKVTYKFWSYQPVFHVYNIYYWLFPPGIIDKYPPEKNKFTNLNNVVTYDEILDEHYNNALQIIQNNYHRTKKSIYHPKIDNFKPYFIGNYDKCLFSFYQENTIITENETTLIPDVNNIAFISSRPLRAIIDNNKINLYYVDYLCVEKKHRKSGIAPELIQTHVYNSWKKTNNCVVHLFKREADLTGIVPITIYYNYLFEITKWKQPKKTNPTFNVFEINSGNLSLLYDLIKKHLSNLFSICILPEYSNIIELINSQNIIIYCLTVNSTIIGFYFFKATCSSYKNFDVFECFTSVCTNNKFKIAFISGFHTAVFKLFKTKNFKYLIIENISHNNFLLEKILETKTPNLITPSAFYFYNFAYTPISSNNFFAIY